MATQEKIAQFLKKSFEIKGSAVSARSRIEALLDVGSFMEIGTFVRQRPTELEFAKVDAPAESVVTGYGTVDGAPVYVFSQDVSSMGGALSDMHAKKITSLYDLAVKTGCPVIGIFDSKGARILEGVDALNGYASLIAASSSASGVILQIAVVCGICGGAAAVAASCFDFIVMSGEAEYYMHSPQVVNAVTGSKETTATSAAAAASGSAAFTAKDDKEAVALARTLVGYLPPNSEIGSAVLSSGDDINRMCDVSSMLPSDESQPVDPLAVIAQIADGGAFFEAYGAYGDSVVTGFLKLDGETVGVVAPRGEVAASGAKKAAGFIAFCDSFNIPLLTILDAAGFTVSAQFENGGGIAAVSAMARSYAAVTAPTVTLVTGKAVGSAYIVFGSKGLGADIVLAWPGAEIGALSGEASAVMLFGDRIAASADPVAEREKAAALYRDTMASPYEAAGRGYVDEIIDPAETRKSLIYTFGFLSGKSAVEGARKHSGKSV